MEDHGIVALYWSRSERAITETASKYGSYCHSIAYNILESWEDAEESVNDTYLGAWDSIPPHRPALLSTFLGKITRRVSISRWRSAHREKRGGGTVPLVLDELSACIPANQSVEQAVEAAELERCINAFVGRLPETERSVFLCRYWYFDTVPAICSQFGFTESKVHTMLCRTRKKLLAFLKKEGY